MALHRAVRTYFLQRVDDPREAHPERAANELLLLHRGGPLTARMAGVPAATLPTLHRATPADHGWMLELIERDEGARAARIARRWLALPTSRPYRIRVDGGPAALTLHGYLTAPPDDLDAGILERTTGGLGLHLVRQVAEQASYERIGDSNVLRLTLSIPSAGSAP